VTLFITIKALDLRKFLGLLLGVGLLIALSNFLLSISLLGVSFFNSGKCSASCALLPSSHDHSSASQEVDLVQSLRLREVSLLEIIHKLCLKISIPIIIQAIQESMAVSSASGTAFPLAVSASKHASNLCL